MAEIILVAGALVGLIAGVLGWVKFFLQEKPAAESEAQAKDAETAKTRAETDSIVATTLRDALEDVKALAMDRKNENDQLRADLSAQDARHREALEEQDQRYATAIAEIERRHALEIALLKTEIANLRGEIRGMIKGG